MERQETNEPRVNDRIRVPRVLLIDEKGSRLGEFMTEDAMQLAKDRGLDLVEVAPDARPPVCRIVDYGKLKYEKKKKEAVARRNQVQVQLKEIKLRPKTDDHDMAFKVDHARRFLAAGNKVKVTVRFRGREMAHREIGEQQSLAVAEEVKDFGVIESPPRMEGRQMFMILAPTKKKMPKLPPPPPGAPPEDDEEDVDLDDADDFDDDDLDDDEE
ncbi:MAG: translation initiation factor IF-3 [Alphaproteobacteria bacterium]|nr:translation initiation factor IF-3 [Alphaproteobacteria bacterium]